MKLAIPRTAWLSGLFAKGRRALWVLVAVLVGLVAVFALLVSYAYRAPAFGTSLTLDQAYEYAESGQIQRVKLLDEDAQLIGERCVPVPGVPEAPQGDRGGAGEGEQADSCGGAVERFHVSYPRSDVATQQLLEDLRESGAEVVIDQQRSVTVAKMVATFVVPLAMLAVLFGIIFLSRSQESSLADIAGFASMKGKHRDKGDPTTGVTFADVAGAEEAVVELREVTDYLSNPERFEGLGASPPKGVLLFGPPGCGKTLLARAVAGESQVAFFAISGAEFVESLVGVGAARVRDLFRQVREQAPAIVFIDEIDAVGRKRGGESFSGGEREQTVNQLLVELDGFAVTAGIVLMGATNRRDILDPALLRPGRFDRHVTLEPPDISGRQAILELHGAKRPLAPDVDFTALARRTPGFTGADLASVVNEAALLAIRQGRERIDSAHLSEAVDRVRHGPQRRGKLLSAAERRRIAVHECGHVLVAAALDQAGEVSRVSVVARGQGLGQSVLSGEMDERSVLTAGELEAQLATAMAGVAAEQLVLGDRSTTAEDDLRRASHLARQMVGLYGMGTEAGALCLLARDDGHLGGDGDVAVMETVSGQTMAEFDQAVKRLVARGQHVASEVLAAHRGHLERMVDTLQVDETLEGAALEEFLAPVRGTAGEDAAAGDGTTTSPGARKGTARRRAPAVGR